ncbi:DUF2909 domain-containing protein [Pseudoalteromonas sp. T1lg65]|uniref:DUF2909 domain-containing protein n=1 Tax=Pseudoalteromonas sp. T1lg65 TaxID=2077101 RepID=UPI003F7B03AC
MIKIIIVFLLLLTFYNLFRALIIMLKTEQQASMAKLLLKRVYASIAVIMLICVAAAFDVIKLNPSPLSIKHTQTQTSTAIPHRQSASTTLQLEKQNAAQH